MGNDRDLIITAIENTIVLKKNILADQGLITAVARIADSITAAFTNNRKVLLCGNGGSAADAQHLAAEFSGRFYIDRKPLDAEALHVNTSYLTAVGNDYSFDEIFARLVMAKGRKGDILIGISTSGNSANVVKALETAKNLEMTTVGFTGSKIGLMDAHCDHLVKIPSSDTPRIQEAHIVIGHIICELVEKKLFGARA
ncbi:MAG TPA: D-sedoheptulose 7-phosphate isomerase [Nitrospirota bacterium]|nr:D-sedoheptulose 7-phosphate isomerase [Nitrospirota bacterium]